MSALFSFPSVYRVRFVCPVVVPPGNPIIEARDEVLSEGNETEMTCTAMSSKPAATIRWMKGDKELPGRWAPRTGRKIPIINEDIFSLNTTRHL